MGILEQLNELRHFGGQRVTLGLNDDVIEDFATRDKNLVSAVADALEQHRALREEFPDLLVMNEADQVVACQSGLINFYADDVLNPYVSLSARGPWLVTAKGAVIHDSGGYGMLGFGHTPERVLKAMARPQAMANVMTPSFSQTRFLRALERELGHTRKGRVFARYVCLNSGSEAVSLATRLSDVNAKIHTDPGGRHAGKTIKHVSLKQGFHGRTDRPAQYSDSTLKNYRQHLASFRDRQDLLTVAPNDIAGLQRIFAEAAASNVFIESMFMEPVMGEGNPGQAITPAFYRTARELTQAHGALLTVDSIQAGLRAHGCLSIVDYPGFERESAPDIETYSKALNAGQYPFSVVAMTEHAASLYRKGIYGNTMSTNPRAMDVASAVLASLTPEVRTNIRTRGHELLQKFERLAKQLDGQITKVQGTGLLISCEVASQFKAYGRGSLEEYLRVHGLGVVHGGENSLRFTPHFLITTAELDLIVTATQDAVLNGPRRDATLAKAV